MISARTSDLSMRFNRWIARFSPTRQMASNPQALDDDVKALFGIVLKYAPAANWEQWWDDCTLELEAGMMTRSWPAPGEIARACRKHSLANSKSDGGINGQVEAIAIKMLIDWYYKFGDQMPGLGRGDRTAELIRRGILKNQREARFAGFTLASDAFAKVPLEKQERSPAEVEHHSAVMARFGQHADTNSARDALDPELNPPDDFCSLANAAARVAS